MNEKMEKALKETLRDGEQILWESGTQPFGVLEGKEGRGVLRRWIVSTALLGGLCAAYAANGGASVPFYAVMLAILAVLVLAPVVQWRQTLAQRYYITTQRAMILRANGSAYIMERENMGAVRLYPLDFGGAAIALGNALLSEGDRQLRWRSSHPDESSESVGFTAVRGMVFYRVENAEGAMRLLCDETAKEV